MLVIIVMYGYTESFHILELLPQSSSRKNSYILASNDDAKWACHIKYNFFILPSVQTF